MKAADMKAAERKTVDANHNDTKLTGKQTDAVKTAGLKGTGMRGAVYRFHTTRRRLRMWSLCSGFLWLLCYMLVMGYVLTGCQKEMPEPVEISYSVCESGQLPKELEDIIETKKGEPFRMCYQTRQYTYIVVGYGVQQRGGCEVVVEHLYEQDGTIYMETNLIGERGEKVRLDDVTYPYLAVRMEHMDAPVVYQ